MTPSTSTVRHLRFSLAIWLVLIVLGLGSPAFAQDPASLMQYVPETSRFVMGANFSQLRKSPFYGDALAWLKGNTSLGTTLTALSPKGGSDPMQDLDAALLGFPSMEMNATRAAEAPFVAIVSGKFKGDVLRASAKANVQGLSERKSGNWTVYSFDRYDFAIPADGLFVVVGGPESFRKKSWPSISGKKGGVKSNPVMAKLLGEVDMGRSMWILADTREMQPKAAPGQPGSIQSQGAAVMVDVVGGLAMTMTSHMESAEAASAAERQFRELQREASQNPMLGLFGLTPLVRNLSVRVDSKSRIVMTTSMTESETRVLIQKLQQLIKQAQSQPGKPAGALPPSAAPSGTPARKNSGAAADFN